MAGRIVGFLSSPHRAAEARMPWLLNGTVSPDERLELEAHLNDCATCRAELERQRRVAGLYCHAEDAQPPSDADAAFARLAARLDGEAKSARQRAMPSWPIGWRFVAALQFCVIAGLAWALWILRPGVSAGDEPAAVYRGLASAPSVRGDAVVFFAVGAAESDVRSALLYADAVIVDGPTAAGAYVLRFRNGATDAAIGALRAQRSVARVESLVAGSGLPPASASR